MRQCKKSIFEGGLRVPAIMYAPFLIKSNKNITIPFGSVDILPTIMDLFNVKSDNDHWVMDGISMLPYIVDTDELNSISMRINKATFSRPASHPLHFWYLNTSAIIDNEWKLVYSPEMGVQNCAIQPPYDAMVTENEYFLFNLDTDINELNDLKYEETKVYYHLRESLLQFKISANFSQHFETLCAPGAVLPS